MSWMGQSGTAQDFIKLLRMMHDLKLMNCLSPEFSTIFLDLSQPQVMKLQIKGTTISWFNLSLCCQCLLQCLACMLDKFFNSL